MKKSISPVTSLLLLSCVLLLNAIPLQARENMSVRQIAVKARQAVVTVHAYAQDEEIQFGSGFFIRGDGVLVTNIHVVTGADRLSVELESEEIYDNVNVLAFDQRRDLIVLQIPTSNVPFLDIADDRTSEVGDTVYVVGSPLGYSGTFSDGLLSAKRLEDGVSYLQISAPISQGSSGGPVLNSDGEVIGVSTLTVTDGQNLNLAVPARHASGLLGLQRAPTPFETFAAQIPQTQEMAEADRASQTIELHNALPVSIRQELNDLGEYEKQAATRMFAYGIVLQDEGWQFTDNSKTGALATDAVAALNVNLPSGSYVALGVCDDDCTDLDLYVFKSDETVLASDVELDADAAVPFEVVRPGTYTIGASMQACEAADCVYWIQLFESAE